MLSTRPRGVAAVIGGIAACLLLSSAALAQNRPAPSTLSQMLVDIARDQGLKARQTREARDVALLGALLEAARRIEPSNLDAEMWLYELHTVMGEDARAAENLARIVEQDPDHETAFERLLEAGEQDANTLEERATWLRKRLELRALSAKSAALVHVQFAHVALERLDREGAVREVTAALQLDPDCASAARFRWEMLPADSSTSDRLRGALALLRINPIDPDALLRVGAVLDYEGLDTEAGEFLERAVDFSRRFMSDQSIPAPMLMALARNRYRRGSVEPALDAAREAIAVDPFIGSEAGIFLWGALTDQGRTGDADVVKGQLRERFAAIREPDQWPVSEVAQAAWFHTVIDPQAVRALALAQSALLRARDDAFVQRVLGWAQSLNGKREEARATLQPIASREPYAALLLAQFAHEDGDDAGARELLARYGAAESPDLAIKRIRKLLSEMGGPPTSQPTTAASDVREQLAAFDRELWGYPGDPSKFLEVSVTPAARSMAVGEPWRAEFSITNRSKSPITLGHDGLSNPMFLVSFEMEGDRKRSFPSVFTVNLDRKRTLAPGATVRLQRTLDIGAPRRISRQTPQQLQRVTLHVVFDPQVGPDGSWRPSPTGQALRPIYFNRAPALTDPASLRVLFDSLRGDDPEARAAAIELAAELLGERQRADLGKQNYSPENVPAERLEAAPMSLLNDESFEIRARVLEALQSAGLGRAMLDACTQRLKDPHWLVRLMAIRLLGRQGEAFQAEAQRLAREDADELVRKVAAWYASSPTTQPADATSGDAK